MDDYQKLREALLGINHEVIALIDQSEIVVGGSKATFTQWRTTCEGLARHLLDHVVPDRCRRGHQVGEKHPGQCVAAGRLSQTRCRCGDLYCYAHTKRRSARRAALFQVLGRDQCGDRQGAGSFPRQTNGNLRRNTSISVVKRIVTISAQRWKRWTPNCASVRIN